MRGVQPQSQPEPEHDEPLRAVRGGDVQRAQRAVGERVAARAQTLVQPVAHRRHRGVHGAALPHLVRPVARRRLRRGAALDRRVARGDRLLRARDSRGRGAEVRHQETRGQATGGAQEGDLAQARRPAAARQAGRVTTRALRALK